MTAAVVVVVLLVLFLLLSSHIVAVSSHNIENVANELIVLEPIIKGRELFASECRDIYPSSFIKYTSHIHIYIQ